jgi:hypothetical protein
LSDSFSSQLSAALRTLVGITRLKSGPEDLPASVSLLVAIIVLATIPDLLMLAIVPLPAEVNPVLPIVISIGTTLVWSGAILRLAGKPERFLQTLTAVFGIQIILAPALVFSGWFYITYQKDPKLSGPAMLLGAIVGIWMLVIQARILRSATGWQIFLCVMLALAGDLVTQLLINGMFPQAVAVPAAG